MQMDQFDWLDYLCVGVLVGVMGINAFLAITGISEFLYG